MKKKSPFEHNRAKRKYSKSFFCSTRYAPWRMNGIIVNTLWIYGNIHSPFSTFFFSLNFSCEICFEEWETTRHCFTLFFVSLTNSFVASRRERIVYCEIMKSMKQLNLISKGPFQVGWDRLESRAGPEMENVREQETRQQWKSHLSRLFMGYFLVLLRGLVWGFCHGVQGIYWRFNHEYLQWRKQTV